MYSKGITLRKIRVLQVEHNGKICFLAFIGDVCVCVCVYVFKGFSDGSDGKETTCDARDPGSISGSGRSPGEGNGNPLQYSRLENPRDRGASAMGSRRVGHD